MAELAPRLDGQLADPEELTADEERVHEAWKLLQRGLDWVEIARQVGYANAKTAEVMVRRYMQTAAMEQTKERRQEALELTGARINRLLELQWTKAEDGDTKAAEFCLRAAVAYGRLWQVEELHKTESQSTKTIVVTGTEQTFVELLKTQAEDD